MASLMMVSPATAARAARGAIPGLDPRALRPPPRRQCAPGGASDASVGPRLTTGYILPCHGAPPVRAATRGRRKGSHHGPRANPAIETDPFRGSDDAIKQQAKIDFMRGATLIGEKTAQLEAARIGADSRRSRDRSRSAKKLN